MYTYNVARHYFTKATLKVTAVISKRERNKEAYAIFVNLS